ncbi:398_t:CDS:2 [Entrophospora sp. SA101]|nr:398_t:CDS:2 [Entrophospora sp. SA101]
MLLWLKKSTATTIKKHEEIEKDFKPFIWTLFHWRKTDNFSTTNYDNLSCINDKIINSTNFSDSIKKKEQINHKPYLLSRLFSLLETFLIREVCLIFLESFTVSIPDRPYILRIMDYIIASFKLASTSPPPQLLLMDQTLDHISLSASAPFVTSSTILLYCYCYKPLFNKPWLSSNPKDLWSKRWHQIFNESFKELGYYPIKNLLVSLFPNYCKEKNMVVGNVLGLFASFLCSGIFHEYIFYSLFGTSKGKNLLSEKIYYHKLHHQ